MAQLPTITDNTAVAADQVMTIDSLLTSEITDNGHTLTVLQQPAGKLSINYKAATVAPIIDFSIATQANSVTLANDVITVNAKIVQVNAAGVESPIDALTPPKVVLDVNGNINTTTDQIDPTSVVRDTDSDN